jgi:hypothetical protein
LTQAAATHDALALRVWRDNVLMDLVGFVLSWWTLGVGVFRFLMDLNVPAPAWAVTGILIWVATSPFRGVGTVFARRVLCAGETPWFFVRTCAARFRIAARSPKTQIMSPTEYAWALMGLSFLVPIAVLEEYEEKFGSVGKLCLKWTDAYHYTACIFTPDAAQSSWDWSCVGTKSWVDASKTVDGRTGDFAFGYTWCWRC